MKRLGHHARQHKMAGGPPSADRIAIFLPSLGGGGAERVAITLAESFAGRGYPTDLVLSTASGALLADVAASVRVVDLESQRLWTSLLPLIRYRWHNRPAVVLSLMPLANALNVMSARVAPRRCRTVLSEHGSRSIAMDRNMPNSGPRLLHWVCRWAYPKADAIIAVSNGVAERLRAQLPRSVGSVFVIHNPVPLSTKTDDTDATHPWLDDPNTPCMVAIGRLEAEKDPVTMLLVVEAIRQVRPVRLLWLGDGSMRAPMEQRRNELGLDGIVEFLGFRQDRLALLARADALLSTSAWEGFGNVIVEALGLGVPVVSTDCPYGPAEILEEGRFGELAPVGDVSGLAAAVVKVLDHPPDPDRLRARSRDFDVDTITDRYLELLGV